MSERGGDGLGLDSIISEVFSDLWGSPPGNRGTAVFLRGK